MKTGLLVAGLLAAFAGQAQDSELASYLTQHQVTVSKKDNRLIQEPTLSNFIDNQMNGKTLFVLGEGNHNLNINKQMLGLLQKHFASRGLAYCFLEDGRSSCLMGENLGAIPQQDAKQYSPYKAAPAPMAALIKAGQYNRYSSYEYVGIDYERPWAFYPAVSSLLANLDRKTMLDLYETLPELKHSNPKEDPESFKAFYQNLQSQFIEKSPKLKVLLSNDDYEDLRYLVSNPNVSLPTENRDRYLAANIMEEIKPSEQGSTYLLATGFSHASTGINGSLVQRLGYSKELKDRILVMNVYCDSCAVDKQGLSDYGVMTGETLDQFRNAAASDLVVFDLSSLPSKYNNIKQHGDLLLFAKKQD
ncbi:MAG: hypothetical protein EOP56_11140 [Sphingobacteriales bacterium]|nr:MAG: hypothetical protein EOP56_11140 [Sphingobacteriales bacterium]